MKLRKLCFSLNVVCLLAMSIIVTKELDKLDRIKWEAWVIIIFGIITPLFTCYFLMNTDASESKSDSLLGLWIKVKKKKLNDQLK